MPTSPPPPPRIEADSVSKDFTSNGVVYKVTVSGSCAHVFDQDRFNISFGHGRAKIKARGPNNVTCFLHRFVFPGEVANDQVVDHIDRNPLNNVLSNLRVVSYRFNSVNSNVTKQRKSLYKGVQKSPSGKYRSSWAKKPLGTFRTERLAKVARILAARKDGPEYEELETDIDMTEEEVEEARVVMETKKTVAKAGTGKISYSPATRRWHAALMVKRVLIQKSFKQRNDAVLWLEELKAAEQKKREQEDAEHEIPRTAEGVAFLTAKTGEHVLVDDDIYKMMYRNIISVDKTGYPRFKGWPVHNTVITETYDTRKQCIDHRNQDKLDNRREKLRIISRKLNAANVSNVGSSKYPGVWRGKSGGKMVWMATVKDLKTGKIRQKAFKDPKAASIYREALDRTTNPEKYA